MSWVPYFGKLKTRLNLIEEINAKRGGGGGGEEVKSQFFSLSNRNKKTVVSRVSRMPGIDQEFWN